MRRQTGGHVRPTAESGVLWVAHSDHNDPPPPGPDQSALLTAGPREKHVLQPLNCPKSRELAEHTRNGFCSQGGILAHRPKAPGQPLGPTSSLFFRPSVPTLFPIISHRVANDQVWSGPTGGGPLRRHPKSQGRFLQVDGTTPWPRFHSWGLPSPDGTSPTPRDGPAGTRPLPDTRAIAKPAALSGRPPELHGGHSLCPWWSELRGTPRRVLLGV